MKNDDDKNQEHQERRFIVLFAFNEANSEWIEKEDSRWIQFE